MSGLSCHTKSVDIGMMVMTILTHHHHLNRGDTTVIVGVGCGSLLGSWVNYQMGIIREPSLPPPYTVLWPTLNMVGLSLLRTSLGMVVIVAVRAIFKSLSFATICALLQVLIPLLLLLLLLRFTANFCLCLLVC